MTQEQKSSQELVSILDPRFRSLGLKVKPSFPKIFTETKLRNPLKGIDSQAIVIPYTINSDTIYVQIYPGGTLNQQWQ